MTVSRYKATRFWAVLDASGALVCVCVYKRGAEEVIRRLDRTQANATLPDPDPFWDPRFAHLTPLLASLSAPATGAKTNRRGNRR